MNRIFYLLFFLSGLSALIYEVVWARQLGLVFGNTTYAISTILTVFFSGLALGSWLFGLLVDRRGNTLNNTRNNADRLNPLLFYALLELGVGMYAALTPVIFKLIEELQVSLSQQLNPSYSGFSLLAFGLSFAGLIVPTILMGGTLPVMSRFLAQSQEKSGQVMGNLYGLNTLGGVAGVLLAGFWLIPLLGVRETVWLAAFINVVIGVTILYLSRMEVNKMRMNANERTNHSRISSNSFNSADSGSIRLNSRVILAVFFITGFAALALEVLWTRVLILIFGSSTYAFTVILAVFLLGIALGSFLASRFLLERKNLVGWLVGLQLLLGFGVILVTTLLPQLPFFFLEFYKTSGNFSNNLWASFVISFLVILPLTTIMGLIFPLGIRLVTQNFATLAKDLGKLYSFNTVGGILGAFAAGFLLISLVGLQKGILLTAFLYFLATILVVIVFPFSQKVKVGSVLAALILVSSFFWLPAWDKQILSSGVFTYFSDYLSSGDSRKIMAKDQLLYYKDGLSATVAVKKDINSTYLRINGKTDASNAKDIETVLLLGHLPLLLNPEPKNVLVVGLGSGITLGAIEQYPIKKVDLVEIEPAILEAARFFDKDNHNALNDPRLNVVLADGRNFLSSTKNKYDVISSEPSNPWVKGNANLFTKEYYQFAEDHLKDDGVFLQWVHYYSLDKNNLASVVATFRTVFPETTVWSPITSNDLMMVGTRRPLKVDYNVLETKFKDEKVRKDLERIDIKEPSDLLGLFLFGSDGGKRFSQGARIHSDNKPVLEFTAPYSLGQETVGENLQILLNFAEQPYSLIDNLPRDKKERIGKALEAKENVFQGKLAGIRGDFSQAAKYFEKAIKAIPEKIQVKKEAANIFFLQAGLLYTQKDFTGAKEGLRKVVELDPGHTKAHLNLGAIYYQEGKIDEAALEWALAKELAPESPEVDQNLKLLEKYFQ